MVTVTSEPELTATLADLDAAGSRAGAGRRFQPAGRRRGFPGTVVRIDLRGISTEADACSGATLRVAAGEPWDDLVAHAVAQGSSGWRRCPAFPG